MGQNSVGCCLKKPWLFLGLLLIILVVAGVFSWKGLKYGVFITLGYEAVCAIYQSFRIGYVFCSTDV